MKKTALSMILALLPAQALTEPIASAISSSMIVGQDPLSAQILRQRSREDGGVTAVARLASGQTIELQLNNLNLHAPLVTANSADRFGLKALAVLPALKPTIRVRHGQMIRKASRQLRRVQKRWESGL